MKFKFQCSKIRFYWSIANAPINPIVLEGLGCSCLSSGFLRAQRGSEPEVGRAVGGLGAGAALPSAVLPSGSKLRGPGTPACQVVMSVYFTVCYLDL